MNRALQIAGTNAFPTPTHHCHALRSRARRVRPPATTRPLGDEINRDPMGDSAGFSQYAFVDQSPLNAVDVTGLRGLPLSPYVSWPSLGGPPSTIGNGLTCRLVSRTGLITGDPAPTILRPGRGPNRPYISRNRNGWTACIWMCNISGDQPAFGPPGTAVTFAPPGQPCEPPTDGCGGNAGVVSGSSPDLDWEVWWGSYE